MASSNPGSTKLLSRRQVAEMMSISVATVTRLERRDPNFPRSFAIGTMVRYDLDELDAWLLTRKEAAAQAAIDRARLTGGKVPDEVLPDWARSSRARRRRVEAA